LHINPDDAPPHEVDMSLEIQEVDVNDATILRLSGQFDFSNVDAVRQAIRTRLDEGTLFLIINLDDLEYIDSAGLGVLVGTLARLRENGGELAVVCSNVRVRRVFDITKLTQLLSIYDSEAQAMEQSASV
jgi:anti-sigma B factor antagonist